MFASTHDTELLTTSTADSKIVWKVFHNSITLIVVSREDNASDAHLNRLLDYAFQSMVLVYGLDDLTNIKNVERFKREIKVCYNLVDGLVEHTELPNFSDLTDSVDTIAAPENEILQSFLDAFSDAAASPYGCLLVCGKVAVATRKWWSLTSTELVLLAMLVNSLPKCSSRDLPVFLPHGSPKVPHRLLTFHVLQGVEVCILCGPSPTLAELEHEVPRFWRAAIDPLKSVASVHPRNFPVTIPISQSILGFIFVNTISHRCLSTVQPMDEDSRRQGKTLSTARRKQVLRAFYKSVIGRLFPIAVSNEEQSRADDLHRKLKHQALETYTCSERHKCYALQSDTHQMFVLFNSTVPTYAMRSICHKTVEALLKDKCMTV